MAPADSSETMILVDGDIQPQIFVPPPPSRLGSGVRASPSFQNFL